ncbi:hypothetical protein IAU60_005647 [Kwoniella sp. DSM 27419]
MSAIFQPMYQPLAPVQSDDEGFEYEYDLSPREKMALAKAQLFAAERAESAQRRRARRESRQLSCAASLESGREGSIATASSSRSNSVYSTRPDTTIVAEPVAASAEPPSTPRSTHSSAMSSSPAPSLPLPPVPTKRTNSVDSLLSSIEADSVPSSPGSQAKRDMARRRSSRVRFSEQPDQLNFSVNLVPPVNAEAGPSHEPMRRESSIDGLRADLASISSSLGRRGSSRPTSIGSGSSYQGNSPHSTAGTFHWTTSSRGSYGSKTSRASRPSFASSISEPSARPEDIEMMIGEGADGLGEAFQPQTLPYPKVPAALSRLSFDTSSSSRWSADSGRSLESPPHDGDDLCEKGQLYPGLGQHFVPASLTSSELDSISLPMSALGVHVQVHRESLASLEGKRDGSMSSMEGDPWATIPGDRSRGSSMTGSLAGSASLRSSLSDIEVHASSPAASSTSSFKLTLPPRADSSVYATLLPGRRASGVPPNQRISFGNLVKLNRGPWFDPEIGLSPRSVPTSDPLNESLAKLVRVAAASAASEASSNSRENSVDEGPGGSVSTIEKMIGDGLPGGIESPGVEYLPFGMPQDPILPAYPRTDSALSGIMGFPIPPDRQVHQEGSLSVASALESSVSRSHMLHTLEKYVPDEEDTPLAKHVSAMPSPGVLPLTPEDEAATPVPGRPQVSLNSPLELEQGQMVQPLAVLSPELGPASPSAIMQDELEVQVETEIRPSSPDLGEMMRSIRARRVQTRSTSSRSSGEVEAGDQPARDDAFDDVESSDDSDLDLAAPLVDVAAKSRILTPGSRLLRQHSQPEPRSSPGMAPSPTQLRRTVSARPERLRTRSEGVAGRPQLSRRSAKEAGWSGSESEEEEWTKAVHRVSLARSTSARVGRHEGASIQGASFPQVSTAVIQAINAISPSDRRPGPSPLDRHSQTSTVSTSTIGTTAILTPALMEDLTPASVSLSRSSSAASASCHGSARSSGPGKFPWGASTPPRSPIRALFAKDKDRQGSRDGGVSTSTSGKRLETVRRTGRKALPPPTRYVDGWGEPEILIDGEGDGDKGYESWTASLSRQASSGASVSSMSLRSRLGSAHGSPTWPGGERLMGEQLDSERVVC